MYDWMKRSGRNPPADVVFCASASSRDEFAIHEGYARLAPDAAFLSFGVHPQLPAMLARGRKGGAEARRVFSELLGFLADLAAEKRICACGEMGFDFFSPELRATETIQTALWEEQLAVAVKHALPVVLHIRKALPSLFDRNRIRALKSLPAAIFHGWSGNSVEARSLLRRGVPAYFCIGKALLRGSKKQNETLLSVPRDRILLETDAPYMTLRGEQYSSPGDIRDVCDAAARILSIATEDLRAFNAANFYSAFHLPVRGDNGEG